MVQFSRFWSRVGAALFDGLLYYLPFAALNTWFYIPHSVWLTWVLPTLYFVLLEGPLGKGQTLGKRLFALRVVSAEGRVLTYGQSFKRYLIMSILPGVATTVGAQHQFTDASWVGTAATILQQLATGYPLLDVIVMARDKHARALHDYLSRTIVLKTGSVVPDAWPAGLERLGPGFPWRRQLPGFALVAVYVGVQVAIMLMMRSSLTQGPGAPYRPVLMADGIALVHGGEPHLDRLQLHVMIPASLPFTGKIARRPERVAHILEASTRRLVTERLVDPSAIHTVVYRVLDWPHPSGTSPTWEVDTASFAPVFIGDLDEADPSR